MASTESPSTPPGTPPGLKQATPPSATRSPTAAPPPRYEPVIKCIGLTKIFRDFWLRQRVTAVDGIDLDVCRGDVFGLLGPNGSGKSTTIKLMLGLLHPTSGRVAVLGKHPQDVQTKMKIGYLPEESHLYPFLNARETLDYYGTLFHLPRRQRIGRIDMLLDMVGLQGAQHRPVGQYSKGMQRRIGLAQALINDPALLILDEPTNGLDPIGSRQIKDLIVELAGRRKTILLCSHLLADVEDVCTRVAIMYGGKVRATGTVDELLVRKDITSIQVEGLNEDDLRDLGAMLEARGKHIDHVDKPRRKLESLFLDIVRQAQTQGVSTGGAQAGGQIAQFLKSKPSDATQGGSIIASLTAAGAAPAAPPRTTPPPPGQPTPQTPPVAQEQPPARAVPSEEPGVVDRLVKAAQPPPSPPVPPTEPQASDKSEPSSTTDAEDTSVIERLVSVEPLDAPPSEPVAAQPQPDVAKAPPAPPPQPDAPQSPPPPDAPSPSPFEKILEEQSLEPWEDDEADDTDSHEADQTETQTPASPSDASPNSTDAPPAKPKPDAKPSPATHKPVAPPPTQAKHTRPDPSPPHDEAPDESFTDAVEDVQPYDPDAP